MDERTLSAEDKTARAALIALARARIGRQDEKFSIKSLCDEAGVTRAVFQRCFAGKQALLAAVMQPEPAPPTPADPWLERRLRVFERALTALETKAETTARDHSIAIAQLKEMLVQAPAPTPMPAPVSVAAEEPKIAQDPAIGEAVKEEAVSIPAEPAVTKDEMAAFLETARRAAREAEERRAAVPPRKSPLRNLTVAGLALLTTLAICAVMSLSHAARAPESEGISYRHVAGDAGAQLQARADSGDRAAQTALALAYLRGQGVGQDDAAALRWAYAAARHGAAQAQYVLGSLYAGGQASGYKGVAADPAQAFFWFGAAARQGHVRAMHNLAIAYAEGLGTAKDPAQAAQWFARAAASGYRDSAFDLGVLYERGQGVTQNLDEAMKWYQVAANEGDGPSAARIAVLREQMTR